MKYTSTIRLRPILALLMPLLAFFLQWTFWSVFQPLVWFLFYPAVFFSAWIGGLIPGLISTVISTLIVWWFFIPPQFSFELPTPMTLVSIFMFCLMGGLFSFALGRLRNLLAQLLETNKHLHVSEARYRLLVDGVKDLANIMLDVSGHIITWNQGAERLHGYRRDEIIGRHFAIFFPADAQDKPEAELALACQQGRSEDEGWRVRRDGSSFFAQVVITPLFNDAGEIQGYSKITQDITRRYEIQDQLRSSEEYLAVTLQSIGDAVLSTDAAGRVMRLNPVAEQLTGYLQAEAHGQPAETVFNIINQQTRLPARVPVMDTLAKGIIQSLPDHTVLIAKNGSERVIADSCAPIRGRDGQVIGAVLVFRDVSEEEAAQQLLHDSSTRIATIFNTVADSIITINEHGCIETANAATRQLFGYSQIELIGQNISMLMPAPDRQLHDSYLAAYLTTSKAKLIGKGRDVTGVRRDGTTFPMYLAVNEMWLSGTRYFTGTVRDITERRQFEQKLIAAKDMAEQANQAKDAFLSTMSHEIRTPLTGMLGMLELLSLSALAGDQHKLLQTARDSAGGLLRIVNDILDWSKIQEGQLALSPQSTSLSRLLQEVVNTYSHSASAKNLRLWQHSDPALSAAHIVDPLRLSQVLNNFVSNAIKFTPRGEVELCATRLASLESGEQICFSVRDTGIGIPLALWERIFNRYQQAGADTARQYGGTGLGLAICRRLADLLDGQIALSSEPGKGSTFSLTVVLPVSAAPGDLFAMQYPVVAQRTVLPLIDKKDHAPLVLAVDDHPTNRNLLARQIELLGLRAGTAADGNEALTLWRAGQYALVITDCHMPGLDGYALTQAIRQLEAELKLPRSPIIAWTANALLGELARCLAAGMDELLIKPTDLTQLKKVLAKWLSLAEADAMPVAIPLLTADAQHAAPVDYAELGKVVPDKIEQIKVLRDFYSHMLTDMTKLAGMLAASDMINVTRTAHRMKGSCRMVGATRMASACAALERAGRDGKTDNTQTALIELGQACQLLEAHLAQINAANGALK